MQFEFVYDLEPIKKTQWQDFMNSLELRPIEQDIEWPSLEAAPLRYCYFTATEEGKIVCSAIILENKKGIFKWANIQFGPLFRKADDLIESLRSIHRHYSEKGLIFCTVQLAIQTGTITDYVEYKLNRLLKIKFRFDRENWSSLIVPLKSTDEEIFSRFSKGHKADIKKALKNRIRVVHSKSIDDFQEFRKLFLRMHRTRGLQLDEALTAGFLERVFVFLDKENRGKLLLVKDSGDRILGGVIIVFQGHSVRYFKGTSDPDYRYLPVLHLAIWEAIRLSKAEGFEYFDLWGYNHFVNESDQVFFINRFKKGFGGEFIFYPKKIYFLFKPLRYQLFSKLKMLRDKIKRNRN